MIERTIFIIAIITISFILGYQFCKHRNAIKISHFCMDLLLDLFNNIITIEEAKKLWRDKYPGD